jgi:hypothetical protein
MKAEPVAHGADMASLEKPWVTHRLLASSFLVHQTIRAIRILGLLCKLLPRLDFSSMRPTTIRLLALVGLVSTLGLGWMFPWTRCLGMTTTSNSKTGLERELGREIRL